MGNLKHDIEKIFNLFWVPAALFSLAPVSVAVWWIWTHHTNLAESAFQIFFYAVFIWAGVSTFQFYRVVRQIGLSPEGRKQLLSGPRPNDADELRVWLWFRRFLFAAITLLLLMFAIPFLW